ncbi:MAG TPA: bifunctional serine/threonine-protein kinase/formylglycine-generating enzyme family protein, partial [Prosthecobacter sp.]|nr:bifunctional serine/threonine-protein kinase/formylglycine-generating enzyme family protein [Prosthecobacter sp.]
LRFMARGGMGAVYQAVQRSLDRTVAIKVLPAEALQHDNGGQDIERFKREGRAMALLEHPGIVTVHKSGEAGGFLYIVMEYVEGQDVAEWVRSKGKLPPEMALKIASGVCDALAYAHERGVVHRDIKPSNVIVSNDGRVKVADFGLAKMTSHETSNLTRGDMRMGTPDFAAPECYLPGFEVDQRADIYAVGVMLYQMLTGSIPRGRFDQPSAAVENLDRRFDAIIDKAMKTDREKRYSTAIELHKALDAIEAGSPVAASARKKRKMAFAARACAVLAVAAWAAVNHLWPPAVAQPKARQTFTNSLGMKFVPVPGTNVLFCIHEARRQDYAAYAAEMPGVHEGWIGSRKDGIPAGHGNDHPVVGLSWEDAVNFCVWLSRREGRTYRLPTDEEWSIAVGLGDLEKRDPGVTPEMLRGVETSHFPWGTHFPPTAADRAGNFGDAAWHEAFPDEPWMENYSDGFATTAPVMSFAPNPFGLYDMAGNVEEFTSDWYDEAQTARSVRGSPYHSKEPERMLSSYRWGAPPHRQYNGTGFRLVLVP